MAPPPLFLDASLVNGIQLALKLRAFLRQVVFLLLNRQQELLRLLNLFLQLLVCPVAITDRLHNFLHLRLLRGIFFLVPLLDILPLVILDSQSSLQVLSLFLVCIALFQNACVFALEFL